jgi:hypothetical protein
MEQTRAAAERVRIAAEVEAAELRHKGQSAIEERNLAHLRTRREIENDLSESHLQSRLIEKLPEVARSIPAPAELRTVSISSEPGSAAGSLAGFLASLLALADGARGQKAPEQKPNG